MRRDLFTTTSFLILASLAAAPAALAQDAAPLDLSQADGEAANSADPAAQEVMDDESVIVVIAGLLAGGVDAPQPPIEELDEEDIAAYGAGSLAELVQALAPQTGSARGRGGGPPLFLVNGVRVSSFREMRSYPPEALERVEILPEEVAHRYGFPADARVVNFILKDGFSSREIELEYGQPDRGGFSTKEVEATYLRIDGPSRLNLNFEWNDTSLLTEDERDIIQTDAPDLASDPDPARYRSLIADSAGLEFTGNWTTQLGEGGTSLSLNLTGERNDSLSLFGLDTVLLTDPLGNSVLRTFNEGDPLVRDSRTDTVAGGATLNLPLGDWQLTATANASRSDSRSETDRRVDTSALVADAAAGLLALDAELTGFADAGFDEAQTLSTNASGLATLMGSPFYLPAGDVSVTLDAGYTWQGSESTDTRNPGLVTDLSRGDLSAGINVGIPLTSRSDDVLAGIGDLTLNLNGGLNHLSDFGTLTDWSVGLNWGITDRLNLSVTRFSRDAAPSLSQLGAPEVVTPNVPVFDLTNGETVLAEITSGGNPGLIAENQKDWNFGLAWEVPFIEDARIQVNYVRNRSENVSSAFPTLTPEIEAALPGRVTRDAATGRLLALDRRAITLAEQKSSRLQFGFNLSGQIAGDEDEDAAPRGNRGGGPAAPANAAQGASGGAPGGGPGGGFGGGFNPQMWQAMRTRICADDAADVLRRLAQGETPESVGLEAFPPFILQRLRTAEGVPDEEAIAGFRERMCSTDAADGPPRGPFGGGQGGNFDPERFAEVRRQLCGDSGLDMLVQLIESGGEGDMPLPEGLLRQFRNEAGEVDRERIAQFRNRICSGEGPAFGGDEQGGGPGGPPPGVVFGGPPPGAGPGGPPPGAGGPPRGGGGFIGPGRFGPGGGSGGRWFVNINHTIELDSTVLIAPGIPVLDLLDGDALTGGGLPRHSTRLVGGLFLNGFGMRWSGTYTGGSRIDGTGLPGSTDLFFDDYATFDVRLFADLGRREKLVESVPFLDNVRVSLGIDNIFHARQRVTDANGDVPLSYQPFLIDPVGRRFEIEFRKLF